MGLIKKWLRENKGFVILLFGMIAVRSAVADWYDVPSSSMYPTLVIGDRVVSNRLAYDVKLPFTDVIVKHLADPQRGDIVTLSSPEDGTRLVKRLVAVSGDVVEMRDERLIINGVAAQYAPLPEDMKVYLTPDYTDKQLVLTEQLLGKQHPIIVMPDRPALRSFGPITIPSGQYLVLGDNRDNSKDSRFIGMVPRELLTGKVIRVAFSLDSAHYYSPRFERFGTALQ
jgi:signal peptidase I